MTKQVGRCPAFLDVVTTAGVDGYVAVDMACARAIVANGHNLGHLGHLVQVPIGQSDEAATLEADYQTVFTPDKAARASATASKLGHQQDLLLRVHGPGDQLYPGHQGGIEFDELPAAIDHIAGLPNVRFAGLTTFPALLFDETSGEIRITPNVGTLQRVFEIATAHAGLSDHPVQMNPPGTTFTAALQQVAKIGTTQVEPGRGLTGMTPIQPGSTATPNSTPNRTAPSMTERRSSSDSESKPLSQEHRSPPSPACRAAIPALPAYGSRSATSQSSSTTALSRSYSMTTAQENRHS